MLYAICTTIEGIRRGKSDARKSQQRQHRFLHARLRQIASRHHVHRGKRCQQHGDERHNRFPVPHERSPPSPYQKSRRIKTLRSHRPVARNQNLEKPADRCWRAETPRAIRSSLAPKTPRSHRPAAYNQNPALPSAHRLQPKPREAGDPLPAIKKGRHLSAPAFGLAFSLL